MPLQIRFAHSAIYAQTDHCFLYVQHESQVSLFLVLAAADYIRCLLFGSSNLKFLYHQRYHAENNHFRKLSSVIHESIAAHLVSESESRFARQCEFYLLIPR